MTDHRFLSEDRKMQESRFANGWAVTVNFARDRTFAAEDGTEIGPQSFHACRRR